MPVVLPPDDMIAAAVQHYWATLDDQGDRQGGEDDEEDDKDRGGRAAVTGGKQMDEFAELIRWVIVNNGLPDAFVFTEGKLEIPGYYRPTKRWDVLAVHKDRLIAAVELKSQVGPSFGNNVNNRIEEALGNAIDLAAAQKAGTFGANPAPWSGWLMLLEKCEKSTKLPKNKPRSPHFKVLTHFEKVSYANRYETTMKHAVKDGLYSAAAFILSPRDTGTEKGDYSEPAADIGLKQFLRSLAEHVAAYVATLPAHALVAPVLPAPARVGKPAQGRVV